MTLHPSVRLRSRVESKKIELYRDLVEGAFGPSVRMEQGRIGFAALDRALVGDPA